MEYVRSDNYVSHKSDSLKFFFIICYFILFLLLLLLYLNYFNFLGVEIHVIPLLCF